MRPVLLLAAAALCLAAACAPKPAANTAQNAGINATADCTAGGVAPGSEAYQDCVNALAGVNGAAISADADQMRAQMAAQQAQMNQAMQGAQNATAGCTTTRDANNNVTTQCP